jgi:hypothetical protein
MSGAALRESNGAPSLRRGASISSKDRRGLEPLDDEVNAKRRLPSDFRKCQEERRPGAVFVVSEQDCGRRSEDEGGRRRDPALPCAGARGRTCTSGTRATARFQNRHRRRGRAGTSNHGWQRETEAADVAHAGPPDEADAIAGSVRCTASTRSRSSSARQRWASTSIGCGAPRGPARHPPSRRCERARTTVLRLHEASI